ncbi:amidophosphoribosyltransferase [Glycomyces sp. NPDC046736]|uniref:amidophosphoribosyltransferase n=1 Tax=Glycomyces sp. NPDC046736 TaxID=3155615 RepID=UPI0033D4FF26
MARGDGRLTTELDPDSPGPRDACGVVGIWAPGEEVSKLAYFGLYALQHRGQEAAGIAVADGARTVVYKDLGLVSQVFDESTLAPLQGHLAIGHARYSTTGASTWENSQPTIRSTTAGTAISLAHNGNLVNSADLLEEVDRLGIDMGGTTSDTHLITALLAARPDESVEAAAERVLPTLRGAFSLIFMDENTLYAARDAQGVHPLVLGRLASGWAVASETAALDTIGATFVREIEPGELITVDEHGLRSTRFANPEPKNCLFEYVYLARPDTKLAGRNVYATRVEVGRTLAREYPVDADLVIGVPESGIPAAIGYAEESGIPYGQGFTKNQYVGRTFIQPSQSLRQLGIRLKLNPLVDQIKGKRLVVVDDTIVRGNTQRALVRMLREAGAVEVHIRISAPPVKWPCFYGIDFATRAELIAGSLDTDGIRAQIGADSLGYVSMDGLVRATEQPASRLCMACFDGNYPIDLPAADLIGKHLMEPPAPPAASHSPTPNTSAPSPRSTEASTQVREGTTA